MKLEIPEDAKVITIIKHSAGNNTSFKWPSKLIKESVNMCLVDARFNGKPGNIGKISIQTGDRFVERYYDDRWYNAWKIYEAESDVLKCYYFNISRPAVFKDESIEWEDLALDLVVFPDGTRMLLDQDEFALLDLDEETRQICWQTVGHLLQTDLAQLFED